MGPISILVLLNDLIEDKDLEELFLKFVHSNILYTMASKFYCDVKIKQELLKQLTRRTNELLELLPPDLPQKVFDQACEHYIKKSQSKDFNVS